MGHMGRTVYLGPTLLKLNMEPENDGTQKESPNFQGGIFQVPRKKLRGVHELFVDFD